MDLEDSRAALMDAQWFNARVSSSDGFHEVKSPLLLDKSSNDHYVGGRNSPFIFRYGVQMHEEKTSRRLVVAAYAGKFATNLTGGKPCLLSIHF